MRPAVALAARAPSAPRAALVVEALLVAATLATGACSEAGTVPASAPRTDDVSSSGPGTGATDTRDAGDPDAVPPPPPEAADNPISVLPVLFLARGAELGDAEIAEADRRILRHLRIAQRFYLSQLVTETFRTEEHALVYRSSLDPAHYRDPMIDPDPEDTLTALKVKELLAWRGEDRFSSKHVYVILFVRPKGAPCGGGAGPTCLGFGRPFSGGTPVVGGGVVELELSDLMNHDKSPFQSTLAHELGHAFGLAHVDCHGYDMETNDSIMSYRLAHHSRGYAESATPGILIAENFFVLAQNKGVFPGHAYDPARHDPTGAPLQNLDACALGPMSVALGEAPPSSPQGYRLSFDGQVVSGPETAYWSYGRAKEHCREMVRSYPETRVSCRFNGVVFDPAATR